MGETLGCQLDPVARGTHLRYLDSDDWLNPGANERQFEISESTQADVVVAGLNIHQYDALGKTDSWCDTGDFVAQQLGESLIGLSVSQSGCLSPRRNRESMTSSADPQP
jgi:hypothetical protein